MSQNVQLRIGTSGFRPTTQAVQGAYSAPDDTAYLVGELALTDGWLPVNGNKSLEALFTTTEANNASLTAAIEVAAPAGLYGLTQDASIKAGSAQYLTAVIATAALTVGALTGDADENAVIPDTERFVDTVVPTNKTFGTYLEALFGITVEAFSPAADLIGRLGIKDTGNISHVRITVGPNAKAHVQLGS